jgi:cobalt-zinc-cadmium efflux system protein
MQTTDKEIKKRLRFAAIFTASILAVEVAGGLWTHSLALLSDAAHMFMDLVSLLLALSAIYLAALRPSDRRTFGWHRAEVFAAFVNGLLLLVLAGGIMHEAWARFSAPGEIKALGMMLVAFFGRAANAVVLIQLRGYAGEDLNLKSAFLHVLGDFAASIGVVSAGAVIYFTGWGLADPIIAVAIAIVILVGSLRVLRDAGHMLLEGVPRGISLQQVADAISETPGVRGVHHLHIWNICSNIMSLSSHILIDQRDRKNSDDIIARINDTLARRFNITDTTLQLDVVGAEDEALVAELPHTDLPRREEKRPEEHRDGEASSDHN